MIVVCAGEKIATILFIWQIVVADVLSYALNVVVARSLAR